MLHLLFFRAHCVTDTEMQILTLKPARDKNRDAESADTISMYHPGSFIVINPTLSLFHPVIASGCSPVTVSQNKFTTGVVEKVTVGTKTTTDTYFICLFFHSFNFPLTLGQHLCWWTSPAQWVTQTFMLRSWGPTYLVLLPHSCCSCPHLSLTGEGSTRKGLQSFRPAYALLSLIWAAICLFMIIWFDCLRQDSSAFLLLFVWCEWRNPKWQAESLTLGLVKPSLCLLVATFLL